MRRQDFSFELPDELIARYPTAERSQSRLLCVGKETGQLEHRVFHELINLLSPGDVLVFNNTRVIPARLFGIKSTGGRIEILVERLLNENSILAHVKASKAPKPGSILKLEGGYEASVEARHDALFELRLLSTENTFLSVLKQIGHMPLPPYMDRPDQEEDWQRYQTVYAQRDGAVAAPTAGLHFDASLMESIQQQGIQTAFVTLHVGAGTFQPVRAENIQDHKMHKEYLEVDAEVCEKINRAKSQSNRIIAVGTTSVRCLETASKEGSLIPFQGDTDIFIYPGYEFKCVDGLITNFHLPESSLLMLVSAFAGYDQIMTAYNEAIEHQYRFYSYGDAMFLQRHPNPSKPVSFLGPGVAGSSLED